METTRRRLLSSLAAATLLSPLLSVPRTAACSAHELAAAKALAEEAHQRLMAVPGLTMHGSEDIAMLVYPGMTALDLVGPHYFFASMMGAKVHLVTTEANLAPVASDLGLAIAPTVTMANCPRAPTVLFVPGGTTGTLNVMANPAAIAFVADRGTTARYVTSVCTGALVLGKAGLLKGKKATTHWVAHELLADFGAETVDARLVRDGRVVTAAGVSAGLDFGLAMVEVLRGRPYAEALMLQAEYAPAPPIPGGSPATTNPAITGPLKDMFAPFLTQARALARAS